MCEGVENMRLHFSILKKFVLAFLLLSIVPLCVFGFYTTRSVRQIGQGAIVSSSAELEKRGKESIELRAVELANRVSQFLRSREADLLTLQMMPRDALVYQQFSLAHRGKIWIREGTNENPIEAHKEIPLYREVAFIGPDGKEQILVRDNQILDAALLRDVSKPENTTYKCERYFEETKRLKSGEIYVSHVTGWYVTREEQLQGAERVEDAVEGKKFEGLLRFAVPCRAKDGQLEGIVMLSLDHRHLMDLTQHILPTEERFVVFPSYMSGNYAFMFDDEGWIISHPKFWDIRGILPDGSQFDASDPSYTKKRVVAGELPFNLDCAAFTHPNYPFIAKEVRAGKSGVTSTFNVGGIPRVMAYAPIYYDRGSYRKHGIFGGITIGVQTVKFQEPALLTSAKIEEMVQQTRNSASITLAVAAVVAIGLAVLLARTFTHPILLLAQRAKEIGSGDTPVEVEVKTGDELEILAHNFTRMAREIKDHQESLEKSLNELAKSKEAVEQYTIELEKRIKSLKNIHYLSHYLGVVFEREMVLQTVLKTCVEGLNFDRSLLYLYDPINRRLICHQTFGFSLEHEQRAKSASYDIDRHDCVPTKVFRNGQTIFVRDVFADDLVTPLDIKISEVGETFFYAFTPIKVQDQVIGVLGADNATSKREITEIDVESLEILTNDAARAIERSQLYQRVISERNFIESIFTHMNSGIITLDESGNITSLNPYSERVFGLEQKEAVGKDYHQVFHQYPAWLELIESFAKSPDVERQFLEHQLSSNGAQEKFLEVNLSRIHQEEQSRPVLLIFLRDITERKLLENHLRRSDRLISLGTLAAGVAHEIRNPLTGVCLLLDDLHDHLAEKPQEREMIQKALSEVERLENVANGLLDFAAPSSRLRFVVQPVEEVIRNTLFLIQKQCKKQNISLVIQVVDPLPPLHLDPDRFRQSLLNLFLNAIHAMPEGGELSLRVDQVLEDQSLVSGPAVRILVTDSGEGIPSEDIEYIFDPFFSRNPYGVGLGLAVVHSIIEEHGGRIAVSSELGSGTTFRLDLPIDGMR
jgi:PAS domain S-box-containing protein